MGFETVFEGLGRFRVAFQAQQAYAHADRESRWRAERTVQEEAGYIGNLTGGVFGSGTKGGSPGGLTAFG